MSYIVARDPISNEYFTTSSSYDRPRWVEADKATIFTSMAEAHEVATKLMQSGSYAATVVGKSTVQQDARIHVKSALKELKQLEQEHLDYIKTIPNDPRNMEHVAEQMAFVQFYRQCIQMLENEQYYKLREYIQRTLNKFSYNVPESLRTALFYIIED